MKCSQSVLASAVPTCEIYSMTSNCERCAKNSLDRFNLLKFMMNLLTYIWPTGGLSLTLFSNEEVGNKAETATYNRYTNIGKFITLGNK